MSTPGSPGGRMLTSRPIPPERGSFPLDHDAECQPIMKEYLKCLRANRGVNVDSCRSLSKAYLNCRMERNLMAPDSMGNLGFKDLDARAAAELEGAAAADRAQLSASGGAKGAGVMDAKRREG